MATRTSSTSFQNVLNFRDVAAFINEKVGEQILKTGQLYRSARLDSATKADKEIIQSTYQIRTVLDLRSKTEHIEAVQKYSARLQLEEPNTKPPSTSDVAEALKIPGIEYAEINLNGKGFERHLVWQLSYRNLAWVAGYMLFGYRLQGISIIGKNVLQPRGLVGLGKDTIQHSGPEIREVFSLLSNSNAYPVLIHCTQGKDRTGLIVILVLFLCGIDIAAITEDYIKSEFELQPEFKERMKEIESIGLNEAFARCPHDFVHELSIFIDAEYGGTEQYLRQIGINELEINQIRRQLLI